MKVLVVGSGGREHALVWKIKQSAKVSQIYAAPGNPGIAELAQCVDLSVDNIQGLADFAKREEIDLTVVGPELPLVAGLVDEFNARGLKVFGPSKAAAEIEGSKVFMKNLLKKYCIPTADYAVFTESGAAIEYIRSKGAPLVVKADGLAAGKGVIVAGSVDEACQAAIDMLDKQAFGEAGQRILVEDCLIGEEVSLLAFTDGKTVVPMVPAQDHKRIFEGDQGPNTGGMGAYSPVPHISQELINQIIEEVTEPTVRAMAAEGREYKGVIYAGVMLTDQGPIVLEFNARFGDPETQVILPRLDTDLVEIMEAVAAGNLEKLPVTWKADTAVCVVMAAQGYPGDYQKGEVIRGIREANQLDKVVVFQAGTKQEGEQIVTGGGRVMGVTALGANVEEARNRAYQGVESIFFTGAQYRRDIGHKALTSK